MQTQRKPSQPSRQVVCEYCQKVFTVWANLLRRGRGRFCSKSCKSRSWHTTHNVTRFWAKVLKTESCWLWTGSCRREGHGRFGGTPTHRYSWELANGSIPDGLLVLHNCPGGDNPACVNPSHLYLGSAQDNINDREARGKTTRGEGNPHSRFTVENIMEIRARRQAGESLGSIGRSLNASRHTIWGIVNNRSWRHVLANTPAA